MLESWVKKVRFPVNQMVNHLVMYNHTVHNYCSLYYMHEIVEAGPPTQSDDSDDSLPTGLSLPLKKKWLLSEEEEKEES